MWQLTLELLASLPHIHDACKPTSKPLTTATGALSREEVIVAYPFVETLAIQRLAHELYGKKCRSSAHHDRMGA